jgi:cobalt-zinc-cadmium efflux system protein
MGAGHDHGGRSRPGTAGFTDAGPRQRRLWGALAILLVFTVIEAVTAAVAGSLALVSDAGHMFTDVLALGMTLAAVTAARRAAGTAGHSFGLYRLEVLAALANALLLVGVAGWVGYEAVGRFADPPAVLTGPMMVVAAGGLLANLAAFALLRHDARGSLAVRGAYLEVLADLAGSVGVLTAGALIALTDWRWLDPLVAVAVAAFILPRTWKLAAAALRVLTQAAPAGLDLTTVRSRLADVPGVADVHDLHVWTLTTGMEVASAHLAIEPSADLGTVLAGARERLHDEYGIEHATLQVEPVGAAHACGHAGW